MVNLFHVREHNKPIIAKTVVFLLDRCHCHHEYLMFQRIVQVAVSVLFGFCPTELNFLALILYGFSHPVVGVSAEPIGGCWEVYRFCCAAGTCMNVNQSRCHPTRARKK